LVPSDIETKGGGGISTGCDGRINNTPHPLALGGNEYHHPCSLKTIWSSSKWYGHITFFGGSWFFLLSVAKFYRIKLIDLTDRKRK
jgi:hypothetical protein